jgi:hypothetical protein
VCLFHSGRVLLLTCDLIIRSRFLSSRRDAPRRRGRAWPQRRHTRPGGIRAAYHCDPAPLICAHTNDSVTHCGTHNTRHTNSQGKRSKRLLPRKPVIFSHTASHTCTARRPQIYRQVELIPSIADSVAIGRRNAGGDVDVVLFVKMAPGRSLDEAAIKHIKVRDCPACSVCGTHCALIYHVCDLVGASTPLAHSFLLA